MQLMDARTDCRESDTTRRHHIQRRPGSPGQRRGSRPGGASSEIDTTILYGWLTQMRGNNNNNNHRLLHFMNL